MKLTNTSPIMLCLAIGITLGCKKRYDPPRSAYEVDYLVVEGIINSGRGATNIKLTRTTRIDSDSTKYELHANVRVEDQHNNLFPLIEKGKGLYSTDQLNLDDNEKYRVHIKTGNGIEYVSDYSPVLRTPPIDSIEWQRNNGVQFFINTHNPSNRTTSYRWAFEETWEFHSFYRSLLEFDVNPRTGKVIGLKDRSPESSEKIYRCWKTQESTEILAGTSARLIRDTIHLPFVNVPPASWKIGVLYSLNVKQYAITDKEYEFWRRMKKNTEQIGTIFDEQPSQLNSNIHNINNPAELVVGYVSVADEQQKRIFIRNSEVPDWNYRQFCDDPALSTLDLASLNAYYRVGVALHYNYTRTGAIDGVLIATLECADCTSRGTNVKPDFWP